MGSLVGCRSALSGYADLILTMLRWVTVHNICVLGFQNPYPNWARFFGYYYYKTLPTKHYYYKTLLLLLLLLVRVSKPMRPERAP